MPSYFKRHPIIGIIFLILLPFAIVYGVASLCVISGTFKGFGIPPQDCEMTQAILKGIVVDSDGERIPSAEISFENMPINTSTPVKRSILSDKNGHFGSETIAFFKCEIINFTVSADGFRTQKLAYILDYGLRNSLPNELNIMLERSS